MKGFGAAAASAAVIMLSGAGGAYAADLDTKAPVLKAPAAGPTTCTSIVDFFTTACQVAAYGVRFYGTIDIGYGYQTNGAPFDKYQPTGLTYFPGKMNNGGKWLVSPNALSQSNIGFEVKEPLGAGWSFIGQVEAGFDPASLSLADGPRALHDAIGVPLGLEKGVTDSNRQGTFYNALGFVGVSNNTWGTLTFLRQTNLGNDLFASYDPFPGSYAFSMAGATGSLPGGGTTETVRATTSVKYRVSVANYRLGVFGQFGDYDLGNASKGAIQGGAGADFNVGPGVFSVDAVGGYAKDAVSESLAYSSPSSPATLPGSGVGNPNAVATGVNATISDNTTALVGVKYTWDKLKLYAGYEWIQFAPPSDLTTNFTDISGNQFIQGTTFNIVNNAFNNTAASGPTKDKILQLAWAGARYSITDSVDVAAAYYHLDQNQYVSGGTGAANCAKDATLASQCHGTQDAVSGLIDWKFAPKWDTYFGTMYTRLNGGLDNGFLSKDNWTTMGGLRFRW